MPRAIGESAAPSSDSLAASPAQAVLTLAGDEPAAAPCRILLADDSVDNRLLIRAYLGKTGYGLDEAENGQVAVDKLLSGRYDLVLMDIQMPVMDGFSAVRRIRQWERENGARHTPIIALTASTFDETVRKAMEAGCDSHLGKPLKRSTLLRVIRETALSDRPISPRRPRPDSGAVSSRAVSLSFSVSRGDGGAAARPDSLARFLQHDPGSAADGHSRCAARR